MSNLNAVVVTAKFQLTIDIKAEGLSFSSKKIETEIVDGWTPDGKTTELDILTENSASKQRITFKISQEEAPIVTAIIQSTLGKNGLNQVHYNNIQQNLESTTTKLSSNLFKYDVSKIELDATSGLLDQSCKISGFGSILIHHV
ncbi:hypothetical protein I5P86_09335 [Pseudomonas glycinae]|uniref:hypothetical protein n=1 Tax=Pseudomonas glycinae TaxID=1785145 RepID=UPI0018D78D73|nr:hypothetical protein [Pseudomonas glycinae]MBH3405249.1 hypothetical protein [Pseudomonas glycinae]